MKDIKKITEDILQSLNQKDNPISILLEEYLRKSIKEIVTEKLIEFQNQLCEEGILDGSEFGWEDKADEFLRENPIIKTLEERWFKELSLQGILILIIIEQYSLKDLHYSQLPTVGGSFNKNNYKKVIKQLKNY